MCTVKWGFNRWFIGVFALIEVDLDTAVKKAPNKVKNSSISPVGESLVTHVYFYSDLRWGQSVFLMKVQLFELLNRTDYLPRPDIYCGIIVNV